MLNADKHGGVVGSIVNKNTSLVVVKSLDSDSSKAEKAKQLKIDSSIKVYETEVKAIDFQVDNIKEKTTIIREFYHEKSTAASTYNSTQIDSFFKARYNY